MGNMDNKDRLRLAAQLDRIDTEQEKKDNSVRRGLMAEMEQLQTQIDDLMNPIIRQKMMNPGPPIAMDKTLYEANASLRAELADARAEIAELKAENEKLSYAIEFLVSLQKESD